MAESNGESRPSISERTKCVTWAAAAGRCTLCNCLVIEHEDLGELVPIGELAHNVGWGANSPRGDSELSEEERRSPENLLLLCRNCHKPADDGGVVKRYTVEALAKLKRNHEQRIRFLTEIGADHKAIIIRVVGPVRGAHPELTYDTVLSATTAAGYFPALLPGSYKAEFDCDLRQLSDRGTADYFVACSAEIDDLIRQINEGIRRDEVSRLAVFGFARIPVLVHLGARLDDKVSTLVFQRQRVDGTNAWRWPENAGEPVAFELTKLQQGVGGESIALIVNLSGTVQIEDLPSEIAASSSIYAIQPRTPIKPSPTLMNSPETLSNFERAARQFLAQVEADHGKVTRISLFPAAPVSAAVTLGRVLMPHVSPAWAVFDRDEQGVFFEALEVQR